MTVIVGAGIVGAAIADALAAAGEPVTVLDVRRPGQGATRASAGILAPYVEADDRSPLLPLAVRSLEAFDRFVEGLRRRTDRPIEYARTGTLQVALDEDEATRLRAEHAALAARGVEARWIPASDVPAFEPAVTPANAGALFVPCHGFINATALVVALVDAARASGATFETPVEVTRIERRRDRIVVTAGERTYDADTVVLAAGSWSAGIRVPGVSAPPVRPIRGQLLHLAWASDERPRRVIWGPRCYVVPWADGSVLVGATVEDVGFDERSTVDALRSLTTAVTELLPAARGAALVDVRVGLRPMLPDGLPALGPFPSEPRLVAATGHYRNGILLTPLTAEVISRYVIDGTADRVFDATSPGRFRA